MADPLDETKTWFDRQLQPDVTTMYDSAVSSDVVIRLSLLEALSEQEDDRQAEIIRARHYHEGDQGAQLTDRLKEFLTDGEDPFRLNVCTNVITAVSERLVIDSFDSSNKGMLEWVQKFFDEDAIDAKQEEVHENALRDGEYFAILDWDKESTPPRPTLIPFERYTTIRNGGNDQGCIVLYEEDDPNLHPQVGVKFWVERTKDSIIEKRNLYYPDRIEKQQRGKGMEWTTIDTLDWTDMDGKPLGVAVIHFKNKNLRPEAADAMPLQRAVNKSLLDLITAGDLTAFRIYVSLGFIPTTDGGPLLADRSNLLAIEPGQVVGSTKPPGEADFKAVDPSELSPLMDLTHQLVLWLAMATNTPISRFISTKLIASDETLKEQEGPLLSRVHSRQTSFGNSWIKAIKMAAALQNTFGEDTEVLDTTSDLEIIWAEAQSRSKSEKIDLLTKKKALGIPMEQLWKEAGYSSKQIAEMKKLADEEAQKKADQAAAMRPVPMLGGKGNNGKPDSTGSNPKIKGAVQTQSEAQPPTQGGK